MAAFCWRRKSNKEVIQATQTFIMRYIGVLIWAHSAPQLLLPVQNLQIKRLLCLFSILKNINTTVIHRIHAFSELLFDYRFVLCQLCLDER